MQSTRMPSAPHFQVPVIRAFILHSGDEAQCTDKLCDCASFVLWLNCGVLVYVYCPSPGIQYPTGGMGFVFWEWVGGY